MKHKEKKAYIMLGGQESSGKVCGPETFPEGEDPRVIEYRCRMAYAKFKSELRAIKDGSSKLDWAVVDVERSWAGVDLENARMDLAEAGLEPFEDYKALKRSQRSDAQWETPWLNDDCLSPHHSAEWDK